MVSKKVILSRSDVVDVLSSTNTEVPLSANQGRVLEEQIKSISPTTNKFSDSVLSGEDKLIQSLPVGDLMWDGSTNQLHINVTDIDISNITVFNTVRTYDAQQSTQILDIRGAFLLSFPNDIYFSSDGSINTQLNIDMDVSEFQARVVFSAGSQDTSYMLITSGIRDGFSSIKIEGELFLIEGEDSDSFISFRMEANGISGGFPLYSFGAREYNNNSGIVSAFDIEFTEMSFTITSGTLPGGVLPINFLVNGSSVKTLNVDLSEVTGKVLNLSPSVIINEGDRISFSVALEYSSYSIPLSSILYGKIIK